MVLRLLEPVDQVERVGPIADGQSEHLQARLAALQRIAALVGEAGDHLADGGQALCLKGPLLRLLEVGDVLPDLEDRGAVLVVGQVACVPGDPARVPSRQTTGFSKPCVAMPAMTRRNIPATASRSASGRNSAG